MANTVYDSKTIRLQDETDVTLVPLPLGRLKRLMDAWEEGFAGLGKDAREVDVFPIYLTCCGIALEKEVKSKFEKTSEKDGTLTEEYVAWLEDTLDQDTVFEILERCGNLRLRDPKLLELAENLAKEQDGQN